MKVKRLLCGALSALIAVSTVGGMSVNPVFAAENETQGTYVQVAASKEESLPEAQIPTERLDIDQYKKTSINTILKVPVYLYHADNDKYSMGNGGIVHTAYVVVTPDGEAILKLNFQKMTLTSESGTVIEGYLTDIDYFNDSEDMDGKEVEVESRNEKAFPNRVSFTLPSDEPVIKIAVAVSAMGNSKVNARVGLHFEDAEVLNAKDTTAFFVDQFNNNLNDLVYTQDYQEFYGPNLLLAEKYLASDNIADAKFENLNRQLSRAYNLRTLYQRKTKLKENMQSLQKEEQGDFTDESFDALQKLIKNNLTFIDEPDCSENDVLDMERELEAALEGLQLKGGVESYHDRLEAKMDAFNRLNKSDYLPNGWAQFERSTQYKNAVTALESGNEFDCRKAFSNWDAKYDECIYPDRVVIKKDGRYTVNITPMKKDGDRFVKTDELDNFVEFSNAPMDIHGGNPTITLELKNGAALEVGDGCYITKYDRYWTGSNTVTIPSQVELKDSYIRIDTDPTDNGGSPNYSEYYMDVDYENATYLGYFEPDKTELKRKIDLYNKTAQQWYDEGYPMTMAEKMVAAVEAARAVYRNSDATYDEINTALANMNSVYNSLQRYTIQYNVCYNEALGILSTDSKRNLYTEESLNALESAFDKAFNLVEGSAAPERTNYEEAIKLLETALDNMEEAGGSGENEVDKTALNAKLKEAKAIKQNGYTESSYQALQEAIAAAEKVAGSETVAQAEVDAQVTALEKAIKGLKTQTPTQTTAAPKAPAGVKAASAAYNKVKVSWSKVSGATGYEVLQYNSSTKKYSRAALVKGTSYTKSGLKTGTKYSFRVRAYKTAGSKTVYSPYSNTVSAKPTLARVTKVKTKNNAGRNARITWKRVAGANGYKIYRATKKKGKYRAVKMLKSGRTVKFTNKKLKKGKRYYYKVRAYRNIGKKKVYGKSSIVRSVKIRK